MRQFPLLLTGSLLLNALLALGWAWSALPRPSGGARPGPAPKIAHAVRDTTTAPVSLRAPAGRDDATADWTQWIERLRASGVPVPLLASLVQADFERRWERRYQLLQRRRAAGEIDDATFDREIGDHDEEQARELRTALGEAGFLAWDKDQVLRTFASVNPPLSEAEGEQLYRLRKESDAKRRELLAAHTRGEIDDARLDEALEALGEERANQTKSILGEARTGRSAVAQDSARVNLRHQLQTLKVPSEQIETLADLDQARSVLENGLDKASDAAAQSDPALDARRLALREARDRAFEKIIGPEAFQAWQRMTDPRWQALQKFAPAWNLDSAEVSRVYALIQQRDVAVRERELQTLAAQRGGAAPNWQAVQHELDLQAQNTTDALRQLLGPERFDRIQQNGVFAPP